MAQIGAKHPLFMGMEKKWKRCRDFAGGEDLVIDAGTDYVPRLDGQSDAQYRDYLQRGEFFGATGRTVQGLNGALHFKPLSVQANGAEELLKDVTLTGLSLPDVARDLTEEVLTVGRFGVLVDWSEREKRPYFANYLAENIFNWHHRRDDGVLILDAVAVRESEWKVQSFANLEWKQKVFMRLLALDEAGEYFQQRFVQSEQDENEFLPVGPPVYPEQDGERMGEIPFTFFGPTKNLPKPEKPPILDVVSLNRVHWRVSVDFHHGLHYTALPTAIAAGFPKSKDGYRVGPGVAWWSEDPQAHAYYMEFTGQGLQPSRECMRDLENRMAAMGGRILEQQKTQAEAAATVRLRQAGEQASLSTIANSSDAGLTRCLHHYLRFLALPTKDAAVRLNRDFFGEPMSAEDAVRLMEIVQQGHMTEENLLWLYQRGELLRPGVDVQAEMERLQAQRDADNIFSLEKAA